MATITIVQDGKVKKTSGSFFRGEVTNYYPNDESLALDDAIDTYLVRGWMPDRKFVTKQTPIVAFGSCFASNISNYLHRQGYNVLTKKENKAYVTSMGDGIVHTFAIRQQFEWAWLEKEPALSLWHGYKAEEFGYDSNSRRDTKKLFDEASVFIITLGLSEIWYDEPTGEVFWRAVPANRYDPTRHKFRLSTFEENLENLRAIYALIRQFRSDATIVFTVSPIPLTATFRPVSCLSANSVSKAILRCTVDRLLSEKAADPNLYYFPSYEIVSGAFNHQWTSDRKHVYKHVLDFNMKIFDHYYCNPGISYEALLKSFRRAQRLDLRIGRRGHAAVATLEDKSHEERVAARKAAKIAARKAERVASRKAAVRARIE